MDGVDKMSVAARDPTQMNVCSTNMRVFRLVLPPVRITAFLRGRRRRRQAPLLHHSILVPVAPGLSR